MKFNSKIYLKKQEDPLMISESGAKKLNEVFLNQQMPFDQPLSVGKVSFFKSEIRKIEIIADSDDSVEQTRKPYWYLYSPSRNTVWGGTFTSYHDAQKELEYQSGGLREGLTADWVIRQG